MIPLWGYAAGGLAMIAVGFGGGWTVRDWKADSDELAALEAGIEQGKQQQELADFKAGRYEDQRYEAQEQQVARDTEIRTIYRTQNIEVPAECEPPADALRVLDDAIASAGAQASGQPVAAVPATAGETEAVR